MRKRKRKNNKEAPLSYDELNERYNKLLEKHQKLAIERNELQQDVEFLKGNSVRPENFIAKITDGMTYVQLVKILCDKLDKKIVIFCEGCVNGLDYTVYSIIYENAVIVPIGSWKDVQGTVMKFRKDSTIFYGVVDRDRRTEKMEKYLRTCGISILKVTAIENVLAVDDVILSIMRSLKISCPKTRLKAIKRQALDNVDKVHEYYGTSHLPEITDKNILIVYPPKQVISIIVSNLGITDKEYINQFKKQLKRKGRNKIVDAIKQYFPAI